MTLEQNVAEAHFKAGRLMEAQAAFWALVRANPRQPKAWERLGDIALKLGQPGQAYDFYGNAYDFNPDAPGVRLGLGRALCKMGRLQEATAHLKKARAHLELAEILEKLERDEEAVLAYRNHLAQDEHDADAMLRLASVLVRLKNYEEADELLHLATLLQSENPAPLFMQGDIKQRSHELAAAENYYRQALRVDPTYAPALFNLGNMAMRQDDFERASGFFKLALDSAPQDARFANNLGVALKEQGRLDEAEAVLQDAIKFDPAFADAHWNLSTVHFLKGRWQNGFEEAEWRWKMAGFTAPRNEFACPAWKGQPLPDGTLLVHCEQGLGDAFQFVRYIPLLAKRVRHVVLEADPRQASLFVRSFPMAQVIERGQPLPKADAHLDLLSAPHFLEAPFACDGYLTPDPQRTAYWKERLAASGKGPWIGMAWQGSPGYHADRRRSPGLGPLLPLLDIPGINLASLQSGLGREQLLKLSFGPLDLGDESDPAIGSGFEGTAAIVANLDLVVSLDSSVAHLAGALGKPQWLLLPFVPDWRWQMTGETSPWYPKARLFRQQTHGDWASAVAAVVDRLKESYV